MKCVNQRFAEISIPDTVDEVPNYMDLASLPAYFNDLSNSTKSVPTGIREGCYILDNELVLVAANELVCLPSGRDVAHVRDLESDDDEEYKDKDDGKEEIEGKNEQAEVIPGKMRPLFVAPTSSSLLIRNAGNSSLGDTTKSTSLESIMKREIESIKMTVLPGSLDNETSNSRGNGTGSMISESNNNRFLSTNTIPTVSVVERPGDNIPLNEFTENDRILCDSFPFEFLLGKGIPKNGSQNST